MKKIQFLLLQYVFLVIILFFQFKLYSQTTLNADGPGNTYELINAAFAPNGGDVVENPECVHPEFGRHITEIWDNELKQYVFAFQIHVTPDNDRCINFDRQRLEIKTYDASPATLKGVVGETVEYKWKFRVPSGFQPSSNFTHLHQIKAVGGDEADPIFTLTARKGNPNKMELNYYVNSNDNAVKLSTVNLSLFENNWVEVTERIKIDITNGTYQIIIKNVATGATILSYSNSNLLTFRPDNTFIRPKWGIYRSLLSASDLRDETVLFNAFSIQENPLTTSFSPTLEKQPVKIANSGKDGQFDLIFNLTENTFLSLDLYNLTGEKIKNCFENVLFTSEKSVKTLDFSNLPKQAYLLNFKGFDKPFSQIILLR